MMEDDSWTICEDHFDPATNRIDALTFGTQVVDWSLGRVGGRWVLTSPTPGAANARILLSDVVVNELMYDPISGLADDQGDRGASAIGHFECGQVKDGAIHHRMVILPLLVIVRKF